jgi:methylisocitrate lyase
MSINSAGARFRQALREESPLQVMGTVNAYAAMMAKDVGYRAIYLSGAGCCKLFLWFA